MSCEQKNPVIGIIMGSESDLPAMEPCMKPVSYTHLDVYKRQVR